MDLLVGEYVLWKDGLEAAEQLLVLQTRIVEDPAVRTVRLLVETVGSYLHFLFQELNWWEGEVLVALANHLVAALEGLVLVDLEVLAEHRVVIKGLLELLVSVVVEARMPDLEEVPRGHLGELEEVEGGEAVIDFEIVDVVGLVREL